MGCFNWKKYFLTNIILIDTNLNLKDLQNQKLERTILVTKINQQNQDPNISEFSLYEKIKNNFIIYSSIIAVKIKDLFTTNPSETLKNLDLLNETSDLYQIIFTKSLVNPFYITIILFFDRQFLGFMLNAFFFSDDDIGKRPKPDVIHY